MVLSFLRRADPVPAPPAATVPAGIRIYAIGDVHGRLDLLDKLLLDIAEDDARRAPKSVRIIFLGDLVDRGPDSRGVIDRVLALRENDVDTTLILGNHEEVFLSALDGNLEALRFFTRIGGRETILSYGVDEEFYNTASLPDLQQALAARVPQSHIALLREGDDMISVGDYVFVHAGVRPGVELAEQRLADLRWIRRDFLEHDEPHESIVVHGHTPTPEIDWRHNRIGVDTGAYETGVLSAIGLDGADRWHLSARDH